MLPINENTVAYTFTMARWSFKSLSNVKGYNKNNDNNRWSVKLLSNVKGYNNNNNKPQKHNNKTGWGWGVTKKGT